MKNDVTQQYLPPGAKLFPYNKACQWISDYRRQFGHWPTSGNCPADDVPFSERTFSRALSDMQKAENPSPEMAKAPQTP